MTISALTLMVRITIRQHYNYSDSNFGFDFDKTGKFSLKSEINNSYNTFVSFCLSNFIFILERSKSYLLNNKKIEILMVKIIEF